MKHHQKKRAESSDSGRVRIIGGKWRSRYIRFPGVNGLRPTGDRIRETLFNWLAAYLPGARCLDAFAGSGALGFEALSRGAEQVLFVEQDPKACQALRDNCALLAATGTEIHQTNFFNWAENCKSQANSGFDVIFIDPPFDQNLQPKCLDAIVEANLIHSESLIYVESPSNAPPNLPLGWQPIREKQSGSVLYQLLATD